MAGDASTFEKGISKAITAPFRSAIFLLVAFIVAVVGRMGIDLLYTGSSAERIDTLRNRLITEVENADQSLPHVFGSPSERAMKWSLQAYDILYTKTGLDRSMVATPSDFTELDLAVRRGVDSAVAQPHWQAMMLGTQLMAARAALLPSLLPTLIFAWVIGSFDGAVARWIRRASGGRESSTIYHRAKYSHVTIATLLMIAWLWSPFSMEIWQLALVLAVIGALLLRIQLMYYKKYI